MVSHVQKKTGAKGLSHKKGCGNSLSPKSVESSPPVGNRVDRAYLDGFYKWILGDVFREEQRAMNEEDRLIEEEKNRYMW